MFKRRAVQAQEQSRDDTMVVDVPDVPEREVVHRAEPTVNTSTAATLRHGTGRPPPESIRSAAPTPRVTEVPPSPDEPASSLMSGRRVPGAILATVGVLLA